MIHWLATQLSAWHSLFDVFQYITLRAIMSALTALAISLLVGPALIRALAAARVGQPVRADGPRSHFDKRGTPTMGGALILVAFAVSVLLWADWSAHQVWVVLAVTLAFGAIGWVDDYRKIVRGNSDGLSARAKLFWQSIASLAAISFVYASATLPEQTTLIVPFFKEWGFSLGWLFIPWAFLVVVGTSNAVNLTDGLDGLAIMPTVMVAAGLSAFAYLSGHAVFAKYLIIPYIPGVGELVVPTAALCGAGLGFLWFNTYPAQVFMGDVGALALGACLGMIAVLVRQEFVLLIMGGVFAMEAVSVILQVASFKLTGRRIFRMAPLHHHFELKGWPEPRVIVRFWIITVILVLIGLSTLKLR